MLRLVIKGLANLIAAQLLFGCGLDEQLTLEEKLEVVMYGVFKAPAGAAGSGSPRFVETTVAAATLVTEAGESVDLLESITPESVRIVNRPQILLSASLKDLDGQMISSVTVTLTETLTVGGSGSSTHVLSLDSPEIAYETPWEVIKSRTNRLEIEVHWKNTLLTDETSGDESASMPTFVPLLNPN